MKKARLATLAALLLAALGARAEAKARLLAELEGLASPRDPASVYAAVLFHLLQRRGLIRRWVTEEQIAQSIAEGPRTRARVRGGFIRAAREAGQDFTVDWVHLRINQRPDLSHVCQDPFAASDPAVEETVRTLVGRRAPADPPEDQAGVPLV